MKISRLVFIIISLTTMLMGCKSRDIIILESDIISLDKNTATKRNLRYNSTIPDNFGQIISVTVPNIKMNNEMKLKIIKIINKAIYDGITPKLIYDNPFPVIITNSSGIYYGAVIINNGAMFEHGYFELK